MRSARPRPGPRLTAAALLAGGTLLLHALSPGVVAAGEIRFTDVSAAANVDGDFYRSDTGHSLGVNWLDFNLDGWPDLFVVGGGLDQPPRLFENLGDGTFARVSHRLPTLPNVEMSGSRFADYDRDGDPDLFVYTDNDAWITTSVNNPPDGPANLLLRNRWVENGGTDDGEQPLFEEVAAVAGLQDLATPPLGELPGHRAKTAAWLDYDRDGCVDLFVGHLVINAGGDPANRDRLFRNRCDGTFDDVTSASGLGGTGATGHRAALASGGFHLDDDGWPDLVVINVSAVDPSPYIDDFFYRNRGPSGASGAPFEDVGAALPGIGDDAQAGMGVDVADVDLDGDWDLYISDIYATTLDAEPRGNVFYRATGPGLAFEDNSAPALGLEAYDSWGVNFFDADNDGFEDLFVSTISTSPLEYLFRNDGLDAGGAHRGFTNVATDAGLLTANSRGSAVADFDRDGDLDLAVVHQNGPLQLFRNDSVGTDNAGAGHWLALELVGTASSPDAIGARIELDVDLDIDLNPDVTAPVRTLRRQVKGGSSAHSQDSLTVHFGLGDADRAQELRVRWPSGEVTVLVDPPIDRYLRLVEGTLFADTFETGDLSAWSHTEP